MNDLPLLQLVEMNAKHVHTNLALRYFRQHLLRDGISTDLCTLNINQDLSLQLMRLVGEVKPAPRIVLFSVYIWNVVQMLQLAKALKAVVPEALVVFGGPEVSFHGTDWLESYPQVDMIAAGEGEGFIAALGKALKEGDGYPWLKAMSGQVLRFEAQPMDQLGIGYTEAELASQHILYYEASRGCPFSCAFCMSARDSGLRYKSLEVVAKELKGFTQHPGKIVKLIDRTFNAPMDRALALLRYFTELDNGTVTFHLEVSPTGLTDAFIEAVSMLRPGLVQFEVGIQSTTEKTLKAISRPMPSSALQQVKKLCALDNCHTHVDLIAGLPEDTFETFTQSIDRVLALNPDHLQLGMLKLLHGAPLTAQTEGYGYRYADWPPYVFFSNNTLSYPEKLRLEWVEEGLERLHNAERWPRSLRALHQKLEAPWQFYEVLGREILTRGLAGFKLSQEQVLATAVQLLERWQLSDDFQTMAVIEGWLQGVPMGPIAKDYLTEADAMAHELMRALVEMKLAKASEEDANGAFWSKTPVKQLAKGYRGIVLTRLQYEQALGEGILPPPAQRLSHGDIAAKFNGLPDTVLLFKINPFPDYYLVETA